MPDGCRSVVQRAAGQSLRQAVGQTYDAGMAGHQVSQRFAGGDRDSQFHQ